MSKPNNDTDHEVMWTTGDVAEVCRTTNGMVARWRHEKRGPKYVVVGGRSIRYRQSDVMAWLHANTVTPGSA